MKMSVSFVIVIEDDFDTADQLIEGLQHSGEVTQLVVEQVMWHPMMEEWELRLRGTFTFDPGELLWDILSQDCPCVEDWHVVEANYRHEFASDEPVLPRTRLEVVAHEDHR